MGLVLKGNERSHKDNNVVLLGIKFQRKDILQNR
jgi:hypothetical protein